MSCRSKLEAAPRSNETRDSNGEMVITASSNEWCVPRLPNDGPTQLVIIPLSSSYSVVLMIPDDLPWSNDPSTQKLWSVYGLFMVCSWFVQLVPQDLAIFAHEKRRSPGFLQLHPLAGHGHPWPRSRCPAAPSCAPFRWDPWVARIGPQGPRGSNKIAIWGMDWSICTMVY